MFSSLEGGVESAVGHVGCWDEMVLANLLWRIVALGIQ